MQVSAATLAKVLQIQELAIRISLSMKHDVFVSYAGHVNTLCVNINKDGFNVDESGKQTGYVELLHMVKVSDSNADLLQDCVDYLSGVIKG